jgi:hypothetical protein
MAQPTPYPLNNNDSHGSEILSQMAQSHGDTMDDHKRLVRELDVLLNGEVGAAQQASLCDIVAQVSRVARSLKTQRAGLLPHFAMVSFSGELESRVAPTDMEHHTDDDRIREMLPYEDALVYFDVIRPMVRHLSYILQGRQLPHLLVIQLMNGVDALLDVAACSDDGTHPRIIFARSVIEMSDEDLKEVMADAEQDEEN